MPKVAIGLPVRNGEKYLANALDSIRAQTLTDFEVLISDNASTDRTREISESFCQSDGRFSYHHQKENLGAAGNFNYVFHQTSGPFFKWAAYDDLIRPTYLEACLQALESGSTDAVLAYPQAVKIDPSGTEMGAYHRPKRRGGESASGRLRKLIGPGEHQETTLHMCFPVFGLMLRSALEKTSLIANMPRSDNLLLVELALLGDFIEIDHGLFLRREHDEGSVIAAEKAVHGTDIERHLARWFDPSRGERFPATVTRLGLGYLHAALRTPMSHREKIRCVRIVAGWMARHGRIIGGEVKIAMRERLGVT